MLFQTCMTDFLLQNTEVEFENLEESLCPSDPNIGPLDSNTGPHCLSLFQQKTGIFQNNLFCVTQKKDSQVWKNIRLNASILDINTQA